MTENPESKETVQQRAESLMARLGDLLQNAQTEGDKSTFDNSVKSDKVNITKPNANPTIKKTLLGLKTGTFLDKMFIDNEGKEIGLPMCANMLLSGLPSSGKSLWLREIVLRLANDGVKVCFTTSEEIWNNDTERYDLESRFKETAKLLGLDWIRNIAKTEDLNSGKTTKVSDKK